MNLLSSFGGIWFCMQYGLMMESKMFVCLVVFFSTCLADDNLKLGTRATSVWSQSSVPASNDSDVILSVFKQRHGTWGKESVSSSTRHSSTPALRIFHEQGSLSGSGLNCGAGFFSMPRTVPSSEDAMFLKYDVYFEDVDWDAAHIGGKLPGIFGGTGGLGKFECMGDSSNATKCFSLRLMWRRHGDGEILALMPANQMAGLENRSDVVSKEGAYKLGRGEFHFENKKWNHVTQEVHLNEVGHTDGWVQVCVGVEAKSPECYTAVNLNLRNTDNIHTKGMLFSTVFRGSVAAPSDCYTYFKNFEIAIPPHTPFIIVG